MRASLAAGVVMQRDPGLRLRLEVQLVQVLHQVLGDVLEGEVLAHIHDVVVEEDARRTPHHHLLRLELAEVGRGGRRDGFGRKEMHQPLFNVNIKGFF